MTSATHISSVVRAFPTFLGQSRGSRAAWVNKPSPVTLLAAFEASAGFAVVFCSPPTTVGEFHSNFVAHEESFVVLGDALLGSFLTLEFHEAITEPTLRVRKLKEVSGGPVNVLEFDVENRSNFTKAALQILFSSVLRKTADIDLVRLKGRDGRREHQVRT